MLRQNKNAAAKQKKPRQSKNAAAKQKCCCKIKRHDERSKREIRLFSCVNKFRKEYVCSKKFKLP